MTSWKYMKITLFVYCSSYGHKCRQYTPIIPYPFIPCLSSASANLFSIYTVVGNRVPADCGLDFSLFSTLWVAARTGSAVDTWLVPVKGGPGFHRQGNHRMLFLMYFEDQIISNHPLVRVFSGFHICPFVGLQFDPYPHERLSIVLVFMVSVRFSWLVFIGVLGSLACKYFWKSMPNMLNMTPYPKQSRTLCSGQRSPHSARTRPNTLRHKNSQFPGNNQFPKHRPFTASVFPPFPCVVGATGADVRRRLGLKGSAGAAVAAGCAGTSGSTVGRGGAGGTDFTIVQEPYIHRSSSSLAM